jgi:imidazole glycerol-phosphate synthase subunit HisH
MVAIIDYDAGNTRSVANALKSLKANYIITNDLSILRQADLVILPGVGHARPAMDKLKSGQLTTFIKSCQVPFLGICLGMQLMSDHSEEGGTKCLGLLDMTVSAFDARQCGKVPHMGWNRVRHNGEHPLFEGIPDGTFMYFVHSYYLSRDKSTLATCYYGIDFSAAVGFDNYFGVQFHPEKSGEAGVRLLSNFLKIKI